MADRIEGAIVQRAVFETTFGRIYAYENDGLGHINLKRIELQIELSRDSGQTDLATKT